MAAQALLELKNVSRRFGDVEAVKGVSLTRVPVGRPRLRPLALAPIARPELLLGVALLLRFRKVLDLVRGLVSILIAQITCSIAFVAVMVRARLSPVAVTPATASGTACNNLAILPAEMADNVDFSPLEMAMADLPDPTNRPRKTRINKHILLAILYVLFVVASVGGMMAIDYIGEARMDSPAAHDAVDDH